MNTPMDTPVDTHVDLPANFQRRLGDELSARAATRPALSPVATLSATPVRPRHTRRIAVTSLGLAAAVAAVVVGTHTGTGPANPVAVPAPSASSTTGNTSSTPAFADVGYTVTVRPGHVVALKIIGTRLDGLQTALRRAGLPAVVLSPSAACPAKVTPVDTGHLGRAFSLDPKNGRIALLDPSAVPHGDTLLVVDEAPPGALHKSVGNLAVMLTHPAPTCFPTSQVDIGEG